MRGFASDNYAGVHPDVLAAIAEANVDHAVSYGDDPWTEALRARVRDELGADAELHLVFNGTAANVLALEALTQPWEAVICAASSHLHADECGAPERAGRKLLTVPAPGGRLEPAALEGLIVRIGDPHAIQPRVVSVTQSTELGTRYPAAALRDGFLYAVDAATGKQAWRVDHQMSWVNTSPAFADGVVYAGSSDERFLQAVDARTGRELWRLATQRPVWSSPAVAGDMVYVGDGSGTVYAVDRASGRERWRHQAGRRIFSSPVIADGVLYVGNDDGGVYAIRGSDTPMLRAVFWDTTLVRASRVVTHRELRDYLAERGYEVLDSRALARFLTARVQDRSPSVVVFSMDHLPATVAPVAADTVLFRRYLDAGGKVVWPGIPPLIWPRDPATGDSPEYIRIDRSGAARLLGVDHARSNFDNYGAVVTDAGLRWGLSGWWDSNWGVDPAGVTETLAMDDNGLASSWVRSYGGAPGTGFVRVYGGNWSAGGPTASFAAVQAVAEYRPATPAR